MSAPVSDGVREALERILSWWPEGSEVGRLDKGDSFAEDIRNGRAALASLPTTPAPVSGVDREAVRMVLANLVGPECGDEYLAIENATDAILALLQPNADQLSPSPTHAALFDGEGA